MNQYVCKVENLLRGEIREQLIDARNIDEAYEKLLRRKWCRDMITFGNSFALDDSACPFGFSVRLVSVGKKTTDAA